MKPTMSQRHHPTASTICWVLFSWWLRFPLIFVLPSTFRVSATAASLSVFSYSEDWNQVLGCHNLSVLFSIINSQTHFLWDQNILCYFFFYNISTETSIFTLWPSFILYSNPFFLIHLLVIHNVIYILSNLVIA